MFWLSRIGKFIVQMCKTWGAALTGGFLIALPVSWQLTGRNIPPKAGWGIIMGAVVLAAFQVWNRQVNETEQAKNDLTEYKRLNNSPAVELAFFPKSGLTQEDLEFNLCALSPAYSVQIQPIVMPKGTATFSEISRLQYSEWKAVKPDIAPVNDPKYRHDFIVMLHNQPPEFIEAHRTPESADLPEPTVAIPIEITYSNQTGREWFVTKFEVLFDFNPLRDYVDARLIEMKPLPGRPQQARKAQFLN